MSGSEKKSNFMNFLDNAGTRFKRSAQDLKLKGNKSTDKVASLDFDFQLTGGPKHTEILIASASANAGSNEGMPLPLQCKWFNKTEEGNIEIPGVSGAFYQPCIDDVGTIICVEAMPVADSSQYAGGPISKEVGPIEMDGQIESSAEAYLEGNTHFNIRIESVQFEHSTEDFALPCEGIIEIKKQENKLLLLAKNKNNGEFQQMIACEISASYPQIKLQKWTNNILDINFSETETAKIGCKNNTERDIYSLCIRIVAGEQLLNAGLQNGAPMTSIPLLESNKSTVEEDHHHQGDSSPEQGGESPRKGGDSPIKEGESSPDMHTHSEVSKDEVVAPRRNYDMLLKINSLAKESYNLKKERNLITEALNAERECSKSLESQLSSMHNQLALCHHELDGVVERNEQLRKDYEKLNSENNFCLQELSLYKSQVKELQELNESIKNEAVANLTENGKTPEVEELENKVQALEKERTEWKIKAVSYEHRNITLRTDVEELNASNTALKEQNEQFEGQINNLTRKYKSLLQETERAALKRISSTTSSHPTSLVESPGLKTDKEKHNNLTIELDHLPMDNFQEILLESTEEVQEEKEGEKSGRNIDKTPRNADKTPRNADKTPRSIERIGRDFDTKITPYDTETKDQTDEVSPEKAKKYEEEIQTLKGHVDILSKTLETFKVMGKSPSPSKKAGGGGFFSSKKDKEPAGPTVDYLQKIVNTLTENLSEKETTIVNQRKINKELFFKLEDYERQLEDLKKQIASEGDKSQSVVVDEKPQTALEDDDKSQIALVEDKPQE